MLRKIIPIVLVMLLTVVPAAAQQTQQGCKIDLSEVYVHLANAQVAADAGNTQEVLQSLEYARLVIQAWQTACTTNTPLVPPDTSGRNKIILYGPSDSGTNSGQSFTKLSGLAFVNNLVLQVYASPTDFFAALQQQDVLAAIYAGSLTPELVTAFGTFLDAGGKLMLIYDTYWSKVDPELQQVLRFSIASEMVIGSQDFSYADSVLAPWMSALNIGVRGTVQNGGYLIVPGQTGFRGMLASAQTGLPRLVVYESPEENLILWPSLMYRICDSCSLGYSYFFDDGSIDQFDNQQAALVLLNHLVGTGSSTAVSPSTTDTTQRPSQVTDQDIAWITDLASRASTGRASQEEVRSELGQLLTAIGHDGLTWLLRLVPVVNADGSLVSFGDYTQSLVVDSGMNPDSRLAQDPVGVGVDLFFGNYNVQEIQTWLGN